jgi:hypothetical protein
MAATPNVQSTNLTGKSEPRQGRLIRNRIRVKGRNEFQKG